MLVFILNASEVSGFRATIMHFRISVNRAKVVFLRSQSTGRDEKLQHTPVHGTTTPNSRTPRSSSKTPRLRQRVFASLERQADRMITLLTPRKVKNMQPQVLKQTKVAYFFLVSGSV